LRVPDASPLQEILFADETHSWTQADKVPFRPPSRDERVPRTPDFHIMVLDIKN
jgi:hypothetical protein